MLSPSVYQITEIPLLICNRISVSQHFYRKLKIVSKKRGLYLLCLLETSALSPVVQFNCCFTKDFCQVSSFIFVKEQYDSYAASNPPKLANTSGRSKVWAYWSCTNLQTLKWEKAWLDVSHLLIPHTSNKLLSFSDLHSFRSLTQLSVALLY